MEAPAVNALEVRGLTIQYGNLPALKSVEFNVGNGRIVGIVGESGSGKSTLASALIGLLPNSARIADGNILFGGQDLTKISPEGFRDIRGNLISMVSQDTLSALNPVLTIGEHLLDIQFREKINVTEKEKGRLRRSSLFICQILKNGSLCTHTSYQVVKNNAYPSLWQL